MFILTPKCINSTILCHYSKRTSKIAPQNFRSYTVSFWKLSPYSNAYLCFYLRTIILLCKPIHITKIQVVCLNQDEVPTCLDIIQWHLNILLEAKHSIWNPVFTYSWVMCFFKLKLQQNTLDVFSQSLPLHPIKLSFQVEPTIHHTAATHG